MKRKLLSFLSYVGILSAVMLGQTTEPTVTRQAVAVAVTPANATVNTGKSVQLNATVANTSVQSVNWTLTPAVGTISSTGLYTAPASVSGSVIVVAVAFSTIDPTKYAASVLRIDPAVSISVTPGTGTLQPGGSLRLSAVVQGTTNTAVQWTMASGSGMLSSTGFYTAPASVPAKLITVIRATSIADPSKSASATITVNPSVTVSVSPGVATLSGGGIVTFGASVSGTTNNGVAWTLSPAVGTISAQGVYSAPATIAASAAVTVKATSIVDPAKSASATINLTPSISVSVTPASSAIGAGGSVQLAASVNGTANKGVVWSISPNVGTISQSGVYTAPVILPASTTITVKAVSTADTSKSATASVVVSPAVGISVTPPSATVASGGTAQFSASVIGSSNTAVTWSVTPSVGTISAGGLYTAPASVSAATNVTVKATSAADTSKSATAQVTVNPGINVSVTPPAPSVGAGGTVSFSANVTGTANTGVTWSVTPSVGTISAAGLYAAPATVAAATNVTVKATSVADSSKSATAQVTVNPGVVVTVSPGTANVAPGANLTLNASVSGTSNTAVTWSLSTAVGTLSTNGNMAIYTGPSAVSQTQTVEVRARSVANSSIVSKAILTIAPLVTLSVTPGIAQVSAGRTVQFGAAVSGTADQNLRWTVTPAYGTISGSGLYQAPSTVTADTPVTVTAQLVAMPGKTAAAQVTVRKAEQLSFRVFEQGLASLQYKGREYAHIFGSSEPLIHDIVFDNTPGLAPLTCAKTVQGNTVEQNCDSNGRRVAVRAEYELADPMTLCATVQLQNQSQQAGVSGALFSSLGLTLPYNDPALSRFGTIGVGFPVAYAVDSGMRIGMWFDNPSPDTSIKFSCGTGGKCENKLNIRSVPPATSKTAKYCVRFLESATARGIELAPEAYEKYREAYPPAINWPDRRPIAPVWVSDRGKRSVTNPRGYFNDAAFDVSNRSAFRERLLRNTNSVISQLLSRPVRAQGVIIWDLEGQEYNHATTYIGDPTAFAAGYAPEMNEAADEMYRLYRDAGFRVGLTIRPQRLRFGTTVPSTCEYHADIFLREQFIKVDGEFTKTFHRCLPDGRSWEILGYGSGTQRSIERGNDELVYSVLEAKMRYANERWGVTLFYIDSAVYLGGGPINPEILKRLQREFPDCLFIPEQEQMDTLAAGIPYTDVRNSSDPRFSPVSWRWAYPSGAMAVAVSDCRGTCWTTNVANFKIGQKIGDIALYGAATQVGTEHLATIEGMILDSRRESSTVTVTDLESSAQYTFTGTPATIRPYPVKLRVYFSSDSAGLPTSKTFCEAGQTTGQNTCTLDLNGMRVSQLRYYDFAGNQISEEAAVLFGGAN